MPFKPFNFFKNKVDAKDLLKKVAPALGAAIGGPFGSIAMTFIGRAFKQESTSREELEQLLETASPDKLLELQKLDKEFNSKMKELDVDIFELEVEDRSSARELYKVNIWPQIVLSIVYTTGYFLILTVFVDKMFSPDSIDPNVLALISGLIGLLTGEVPRINAFWFGSSMGSKNKDEKMLRGGK